MSKKSAAAKWIKYAIGSIIFVLAVAFFGYVAIFSRSVKMNPEGTIGNTAGNLNNNGLFCEYNEKVYFSNVQDGGALYQMNPNETEMKKLYAMQVRNLLAGGDYLYYFQLNASDSKGINSVTNTVSFNRCKLDGSKSRSITKDPVVSGQLVGNDLYLLTAGKQHPLFYKIKIDRSSQSNLADHAVNPACTDGRFIYYNGTTDNHALYRLDTKTDNSAMIWDGNLWNPVLDGNYIYYMDLSSNYRLCRLSLADQTVEVLTNDRVELYNVGSGYIYYQTGGTANPQLKCMHSDGSNQMVVADGVFNSINMTSQYVYFCQYGVTGSMFHSRLGSDSYSLFPD